MQIRTIEQAYEEIRKNDPDTAISKNYIRSLVSAGEIPHIKAGAKFLVDLQVLEGYISSKTKLRM